eukprot:497336-Prymnesium_polylepis.1
MSSKRAASDKPPARCTSSAQGSGAETGLKSAITFGASAPQSRTSSLHGLSRAVRLRCRSRWPAMSTREG